MKIVSKKAFTLIELLVVITIIGILATGAVSVYTSQIQKGRDATRISSMEALRGAVEQYYQDATVYPSASGSSWNSTGVLIYMNSIPRDPKSGQKTNSSFLDYSYYVGADSNGLAGQEYEISDGLENAGNVQTKAEKDDGNENTRLEIGINMIGNNSGSGVWAVTPPVQFGVCPGAAVDCMILK